MQRHQLQHVILEIGRRFELRDFYIVDELLARLESVSCSDEHRRQIAARVRALFD